MIKVNSQSFSLPSTLKQTSNSYDDRAQQQPLEKIESVSISSSPVPPSSTQYNQQQLHSVRSKTPTSISPNTWQLCYVTERILAAILPIKDTHHSQKIDDLFYDENGNNNRRNDKYETDLLHMLEQKHGKNFRLFDLESCIPTISLEKLCELCKHIETWLNGGTNKIVVLQDRESFQRVGTCVAAYLQYQKICSLNLGLYSLKSPESSRNIQDLDEYSMQKFLEDIVGPITQPCYRRYLEYFIGLLSGEIKMNSLPLYLKFIKMESPPCMHHKISKYDTEWSSFIKIFEGERFVFISDIYVMPISTKQFIYEIKSPIILRGDIFIHFFQIHNKSRQTELISSIQFHTCAISRSEKEFFKNEISFPQNDEKFPMDHKVTLIFTKTPEKVGYNREIDNVLIFQNPLIRKEPISNYSSIADLSQYTQGPLDGSLYATIAKNGTANNELTLQNIQTIETRLNTPISKNSRILSTILEWDNVRNENGLHNNHSLINGETSYSQIAATASSSSNVRSKLAPIEPPPRSFVKSPLQRSFDSGIFSHEVTNKNNTSSALSWHDRASPTVNNCHDELDNLLSEMLLTVEKLPDINGASSKSKQKLANIYTTTNNNASSPIPVNISENIHTSDTIKRSPKSPYSHNYDTFGYSKNNQQDVGETSSITTTLTPSESGRNTPAMSDHQFSKGYYTNQDELFYDTDTQMQLHGNRNRHAHMYDQQQKQAENLLQSQSQSYMEVLRSENNSTIRSGRSSRFDESNIPYHAREYSKPFSYLPSTGEAKMFKMQSGLSSPSMVRKALNNGTSGRKTPSQVDFVERTRTYGGRQYNESKYTFGDKTPESNLSVFDNDKLLDDYNSRNRSENSKNNYSIDHIDVVESTAARHFEPLRRSNTMDGSFGRSGYASDGGSSHQTWLQVQQQRLRAKREQKQHEGFDFTDGAISRRSQTLSPVRQHYNSNYTLSTGKEPKFVQVKRTTEQQAVSRPYKNEVEMNNHSFDLNQNRTVSPTYDRLSYNEKITINNRTGNNLTRRSKPVTSTPNEEMDRINNNNPESPKTPFETLDNLLESIAFESHTLTLTTSTMVAVNSDNVNNNNATINQKTDTLNRYLDNVINYNNVTPKSDSDSSQSSDHVHNGKMPSQQPHQNRRQTRNESVSSYRSETETEVSRPETPAFPVTPRTPIHFGSTSTLPPKSPTLQRPGWALDSIKTTVASCERRRDLSNRIQEVANINETVSTYASRRNSANSATSNANSEPFEIAAHHVKFARDSSKFWYKPTLSREEAINLLRNAPPGTFLVRDSTTFANAFGLVVRVAQIPPGSKGGIDELVRHFLVEPTVRGVRLKGCSNEPVFSSLSALIYQHTVTPLALPCRLVLPERDIQQSNNQGQAQQQLAVQGAACNVLYLFSADTESLTGPQAVRKAIRLLFERRPLPSPTEVHLKVSNMGVTLTDNSRQLFFRKHYPAMTISYIGLDPDDHRWSVQIANADIPVKNQHIFAFVAKKTATSNDNQCHIFCELETRQPASAIVSFAQKILMDETTRNQHAPAQI